MHVSNYAFKSAGMIMVVPVLDCRWYPVIVLRVCSPTIWAAPSPHLAKLVHMYNTHICSIIYNISLYDM